MDTRARKTVRAMRRVMIGRIAKESMMPTTAGVSRTALSRVVAPMLKSKSEAKTMSASRMTMRLLTSKLSNAYQVE